MFARRSKLFLDSQIVAETPLLLPSFSSKGFPQIKNMMRFMSEFITGPVLVSAYDIHYRHINPKITFSDLIFLDSGGYEARVEHDLSESYGWPHRPKHWNRRYHENVLKNWVSKWPTVAITYDNPTQFQRFSDQTKMGRRFKWETVGIVQYLSKHISASHHLMRGTAVDNPPDATTHHRVISANTPQPRYSRV